MIDIQGEVGQHMLAIKQAQQAIRDAYVGKSILVTSQYWNGQMYGRSKKPAYGKVFKIKEAFCDDGREIYFFLEGERVSINSHQCIVIKEGADHGRTD